MNHICFSQILHLVGKGYSVNFSKAEEFKPSQVLRIIMSKGEHHHMEIVDISHEKMKICNLSVDYLISRALTRSEWELDNYIEQQKENEECL